VISFKILYNRGNTTIFLSIDDTDSLESRGTGRLARTIADAIAEEFLVYGVTRHQLFVHEDIPYTSHNSCAVIHICEESPGIASHAFTMAQDLMLDDFIEGSDPGVAIALTEQIAPSLVAYGRDAQHTILTQERARTLARNLNIPLLGLGGTEDGVIGAMAGLALASTRNDGRFLQLGAIRDIAGPSSVEDLLAGGIDEVWNIAGPRVTRGIVQNPDGKSPKPCPVNGRAVLFVEERDGELFPIKRD
jgi:hypothetical protein